ncbi:MAG: GNAT family N-acetyltransferase [Fusobacteriaceae bacterium]
MVRIAAYERDKESAYKLWSQCFTDSSSYIEYYFSQRFKMENYLLVERNGDIKGGMHCNPYSMNFYGEIKKSYYLVAIGTYPEYRGEGILRELLQNFFERCRQEGVREIFLAPINPEIYFRYGFSYTHTLQRYEIALEKIVGKNYENLKIHELKKENTHVLNYINTENSKFISSLIKSQEEFSTYVEELNFEGGHIYWIENSKGEIEGTFSYIPQDGDIYIRDFYFKSSETFSKILYFISSFKGYYKDLKIDTFKGQELETYFSNRKELEIKTIPFIMTKIIDMESALRVFFEKSEIDEINLKIWDNCEKRIDYYRWNGEKISLEYEGEPDLELDRESLTSLLYGVVKIETLKKQGKIKIKSWKTEILLSRILNDVTSYIQEYV